MIDIIYITLSCVVGVYLMNRLLTELTEEEFEEIV